MLSQQNSRVLLCGIWMRCVKMKQRQCGRYAMLHHWAQEGKGQYKQCFLKSEAVRCWFIGTPKSHIPILTSIVPTESDSQFGNLRNWQLSKTQWPSAISLGDSDLGPKFLSFAWRLRPEPYCPRILRRSPSTLRGFGVAGEWRPSFLKVTLNTNRKMFQISF